MVNLDNEVSYIVKDSFLDSDYNPVNVAPGGFYHQFLLKKYVKVSNVPYAASPRSIEEIQPPREVPRDVASIWITTCPIATWPCCATAVSAGGKRRSPC